MALTKYMQADFDALRRGEDGYINLPRGDWSGVDFGGADNLHIAVGSFLGDMCKLGYGCVLGNGCALGKWCVLGSRCKLGDDCTLGSDCALDYGCELGDRCVLGNMCVLHNGCKLGKWCVLGNMCVLHNGCKLGYGCVLGKGCKLGDGCVLGDVCELGDGCELGSGCAMEGGRVPNAAYFISTNIGSRNDSTYAYCNTATGDIYVRAGCWFGGLDDFVERVHEVHAGTQHETDYIAFAEFARARFRRYGK